MRGLMALTARRRTACVSFARRAAPRTSRRVARRGAPGCRSAEDRRPHRQRRSRPRRSACAAARRRWAWLPLAALELGLAVGLLAAPAAAAWAAAALFAGFAGGAGDRDRRRPHRRALRLLRRARTGVVELGRAQRAARGRGGDAGACERAATRPPPLVRAPRARRARGGGAIVLRARRPDGALEIADEGPPLGARLALGDGVRLALFTADGCRLCRALIAAGAAARRRRLRRGRRRDSGRARPFPAPRSRSRSRPTARCSRRARSTRAPSCAPSSPPRRRVAASTPTLADGASRAQLAPQLPRDGERGRRRDHRRAARRLARRARRGRRVSLLRPHLHDRRLPAPDRPAADRRPWLPAARPRRQARRRPRPADRRQRRADRRGRRAAARPRRPRQPAATRTRVCTAAGKRYGITVRTDGAWYRCCNGHVRKLVDCCTTSSRRINGDRALRGYCYGKRRVFCVMYFQTKVPC